VVERRAPIRAADPVIRCPFVTLGLDLCALSLY
jgi:hypothetical protein